MIVSSTSYSFAQSEIIPDDSIYLWVPEKMIQGESYEGLVVLSDATNNGRLALITSGDSNVVTAEQSVFINQYSNHGVFQITPKNEGLAEIFVSINGDFTSKQVHVYSQKSGAQSLEIFLPSNSTKSDTMPAYVFVLDGNGAPVPVKNNTDVKITSTNRIGAPPNITLKQGEFYAKFLVTIKGDGTLSVSGDNLKSDTVNIKKTQDIIDVTFAYYYVWLEKDGRPFNLPFVVDVFIHSTDPAIARLTPALPKHQNDNLISVSMINGVAKGIFYTGKIGHATLTASMSQFGSTSADVFVGPAIMGAQDIPDDKQTALQEFEAKYGRDRFVPDKPNSALFWIYPDITSENAWGVAALYFSNSTETIDITVDEQGSQISHITEKTTMYPITADGRTMTVSSSAGLEHDGVYEMSEHGLKTHAIEFEIIGNSDGQYIVELSGTGIETTSAAVEINTSEEDEYDINIVPLPIQTNIPQELAIVSIADYDGDLVDVKDTFGKSMELTVYATSARLNNAEFTIGSGNTGSVAGILTGVGILSITSDNLGLEEQTLYPAGISTSLELLVPQSVHVGEEFPFVIHEVDSLGVPLKKTTADFSSLLGLGLIGDSFVLNIPGNEKITVLSDIGASQKEILSFLNHMDISVNIDKSLVRVGDDVLLQITNTVSDAIYSITSPFPYEKKSDSTFILTPDSEIVDAEIIVKSSKDGYLSQTNVVTITSEHIVTVNITSMSTGGKELQVPYAVEGTGNSTSQTPQSYELKPQQITIIFPQKHISNGGYEFQNVSVNGHMYGENTVTIYADKNYDILANYQRQIRITVNDGVGSGIYPYGVSVVITAPEKQKMSFLVRDVFDHWTGIQQMNNPFVMNATKDIVISAVYREDYSYLMIVVFAGVSALSGIIVKKRNAGYEYKIKDMADKIVNIFKRLLAVKIPKSH